MSIITKILKYPVGAADKLADRASATLGAIGLSQLPGYISHYVQRLGGHLDEAKLNVEEWFEIARRCKLSSVNDLINVYLTTPKQEVVEAGRKAAEDVRRVEYLKEALESITSADMWHRPVEFLQHMDVGIATETLRNYTPNVPTNLEGVVYAGAGLIVGSGAYWAGKKGAKVLVKQIKKHYDNRKKKHEN